MSSFKILLSSPIAFILLALVCTVLMAHHCDAQVLFSRDWNPGNGKRSSPDSAECHSALRSVTSLCHLMINQVSQLASCQDFSTRHEDVFAAPVYPPKL